LLIHFGARRDAVDGDEEELLGLDLAKEKIDIGEYRGEYLFLRQAEVRIVIVWMRTVMDDAVEIEVEVVEFGDVILLDEL
jgi:hypothetical protein